MVENEDPNIVVMHREMYDLLLSCAYEMNWFKVDRVKRHVRKFNKAVRQEREQEVISQENLRKFLTKKRHLLSELHRKHTTQCTPLEVWANLGTGLRGYHFNGIFNKHFVKLCYHVQHREGKTTHESLCRIEDLYLEYSDELDSYTSSIISAAVNCGFYNSPVTFKETSEGFRLCDTLGLIQFLEDKNKDSDSCHLL